MRLLIVTQKIDESDDVLGFFITWILELAKKADQINIICLAKGSYSLPLNVKVTSLGKENDVPKILQAVRFYFQAFLFLLRSDGIFVHMAPEYARALYPLNIFFRKPIVMWYAHIKVSPVAAWAIRHVDFVLTPSKESFQFDSPKIISTGHGIDVERFAPRNSQATIDVLSLSRISKVKRIETLIEALSRLNDDHKVTADIYGKPARPEDGKYMDDLKSLIKEKEVNAFVSWKGSIANKDAPEVYASHRIFARMQGGGGFGKTELEAMAMGIPAILPTPVYRTELPEFADDLYFPEDDAVALADRISRVLAWSSERRAVYARNARSLVVRKHNITHVADEIIRLLKEARKG